MITALVFTFLTGVAFASISMIVSTIAKTKISFFQFFTLSNLLASALAWILLPKWGALAGIEWGKLLLLTAATGFINTASQAAFVCSLKWGHNGLSVAIRNTASILSMTFALIFLHEKISLLKFSGVLLVILSLGVIAIFGKKNSITPELKKWLPAVILSLLFSGSYQILLTGSVLLSETTRNSGVLIPCLMGFCGLGNFFASLIEKNFSSLEHGFWHFEKKVFCVLTAWSFAAMIQYFLLLTALNKMKSVSMTSLAWPILIGVNVTVFSIFCRFRWKEKYPVTTVIGMTGCVTGLILIVLGK